MFKDKVVVVTGGASGIGRCIADSFKKSGACVCIIDKDPNEYFIGDISDEIVLNDFSKKVIQDHGRVDCLINNAMINRGGLFDCSIEDFNYTLKVGVTAPFILAKLFKDYFSEGASIVNISSTRDRMSQSNTESYTAAKGGLSALTHALAVTLAGKVRVNSVSPGWIDTIGIGIGTEDKKQHPAGRVGTPQDVADLVMFLCSEEAGFITGENIVVDGGMTRLMIYHGDNGWIYSH